MDGIACKKNWV